METYAISSANLNAISDNLGEVARELNGVIQNVNSVNTQINTVEEKVSTLDSEIKSLVREIRETTFITSARQNIMYNNEQIEKKFGYFENVRRNTLGLLESINSSKINKSSIENQREKLLLNNPNYWLTNAYAAVSSWILDDKKNCIKEVNNALKKDNLKTRLFFCLINLKFNRIEVSLDWLESYLENINPLKLDSSFINILELCSNDSFGIKGRELIKNKIEYWINVIQSNNKIKEDEINKWINFISSKEQRSLDTPYLDNYSSDKIAINDNLFITSSYKEINHLISSDENILQKELTSDEILYSIINDYQNEEKKYQEDNFKNKLIIEYNGNKELAELEFERQKSIYEYKTNLISLLNNIVIYTNRYNVSKSTRNLALYFIKDYIKEAYKEINSYIIEKDINLNINNMSLLINKDTKMKRIDNEINKYINSIYNRDDKLFWIFFIVINIIGIIGIFLILSNMVLCSILVLVLIIGNIVLLYKMYKDMKSFQNEKESKRKELYSVCEILYSELSDYFDTINKNNSEYNKLINNIDSLNIDSYINSNNRNIDIG